MRSAPLISASDTASLASETEMLWKEALPYFQQRGGVLFLSGSRFWETHGFVQQSLAKTLVDAGVSVTWLDGMHWRGYRPTVRWPSPLLRVKQLFALPGRRFSWINSISLWLQRRAIALHCKSFPGGRPVIWVQDAIDDGLAARLPYVDIVSVFDNPYSALASKNLCQKARAIVTQNSFSRDLFAKDYPEKTHLGLPPVEMETQFESPHGSTLKLPAEFPKKVMGYVGSFFSDGFDLVMMENFIRMTPEWGFLLMGRTDAKGLATMESWKKYKNFVYIPWADRDRVGAAWRSIDVSLLLYRPFREQDGAFPVKVLESLYFGVPCVATRVPKTVELEGYFPRIAFPDRLRQLAMKSGEVDPKFLKDAYLHFAAKMNPKRHLSNVAQWLR